MTVILKGYQYSVYQRITRMVLAEKSIEYKQIEVDPFTELPSDYLAINPFGRVPTLIHNDFSLYETTAITRYLDESFPGPSLQPDDPRARARMTQIISIIDSYGYWPLIRQVFSQKVFASREGYDCDEEELASGLKASSRVLEALEKISEEGRQLSGNTISLADLHLAPMIAYFIQAPEGKALFSRFPNLSIWWKAIAARQSLLDTDPGLPGVSDSVA